MKRYYAGLLFLISSIFLFRGIFRPLWCDEALTIMNFTTLPFSRIYTEYVIANNHILYTYLLKLWISFIPPALYNLVFLFRLPGVFLGIVTLLLIYFLWRKYMGRNIAFILAMTLAVSHIFMIYATAVRGYILGLLFVVTAIDAAMNYFIHGRKKYLIFYMFASLGGIAVIPSNVIVFSLIPFLPLFFLKHIKYNSDDLGGHCRKVF